MENTKKVLLTAILSSGILLSFCQQQRESSQQKNLRYIPVKDSILFRDEKGLLSIRLPYREVHENEQDNPQYTYLTHVSYHDTAYRLDHFLDTASFHRVPNTLNYWIDTRFVYADPYVSLPGQPYFLVLDAVQNVQFKPNPDSVLVKGNIWYRGVPLHLYPLAH